MAIQNFQRVENYFQLLKEQKVLIQGSQFDAQFSDLILWINQILIPEINGLQPIAPAFEDNQPRFLFNNGNATSWETINVDTIGPGVLHWSKFATATVGSILHTNGFGNYAPLTPTAVNQLIRCPSNSIAWGTIDGSYIEDNCISGQLIGDGQILQQHLAPDAININALNATRGKIKNSWLADRCITTEKMTNGYAATTNWEYDLTGVDMTKFYKSITIDYTDQWNPNNSTKLTWSLTLCRTKKIKNNQGQLVLEYKPSNESVNAYFDVEQLHDDAFKAGNTYYINDVVFPRGSEPLVLGPWNYMIDDECLSQNNIFVDQENVHIDITKIQGPLTSDKLALNVWDRTCFDEAVSQAFYNKGCRP